MIVLYVLLCFSIFIFLRFVCMCLSAFWELRKTQVVVSPFS